MNRRPGPGPFIPPPPPKPINASDDIKLKILADKVREQLSIEFENIFVEKEDLKTLNNETLIGHGNISLKAIKEIKKVSSVGLVDTYKIIFSDNSTMQFTVTNGAQGPKGDKGDKGDQGPMGPQGPQGIPGQAGKDGLTEEEVIALLESLSAEHNLIVDPGEIN